MTKRIENVVARGRLIASMSDSLMRAYAHLHPNAHNAMRRLSVDLNRPAPTLADGFAKPNLSAAVAAGMAGADEGEEEDGGE